jgi:hypothetical protein
MKPDNLQENTQEAKFASSKLKTAQEHPIFLYQIHTVLFPHSPASTSERVQQLGIPIDIFG